MELCQHLHQGPLVLQGAASAHTPLVVLLVSVAVSGAPCGENKEIYVEDEDPLIIHPSLTNDTANAPVLVSPDTCECSGGQFGVEVQNFSRGGKLQKMNSVFGELPSEKIEDHC